MYRRQSNHKRGHNPLMLYSVSKKKIQIIDAKKMMTMSPKIRISDYGKLQVCVYLIQIHKIIL